ncbi:MAG: helix-turn-helix transcriptional regulator [Deltaproteobacteria bacterium]|nr:helix-turn-helix transcriptional regulator [Deltaproteobacteria bacterium]
MKIPTLRTPVEVATALGRRVSALRLARDWRRATLAERAGVGLSTVQRLERSGHITLDNLLKIAAALGRLEEFEALFEAPAARSIDELERASTVKLPKRGRR